MRQQLREVFLGPLESPLKFLLGLILFTFLSYQAFAYETDQYTSTFHQLKDSTEILNQAVNRVIEEATRQWDGPRDDFKFASLIKKNLNARQLEYWVNLNSNIDSWSNYDESIYSDLKWFNSPIIRFKGIAHTFSLAGVHVGSDKMSHFFGVGGIYYTKKMTKFKDLSREEMLKKILRYGKRTEHLQWGELTTNVYSNADLVVNYEGFLFYESLFSETTIPGKKSIIKWQGDTPSMQRKFTFKDHVNDFWSEALLPNYYQPTIRKKIKEALGKLCYHPFYKKNKELFLPRNEDALMKKYQGLHFKKKGMQYRMDKICTNNPLSPEDFIFTLPVIQEEETEDVSEEDEYSGLPGCKKNMIQAENEFNQIQKHYQSFFQTEEMKDRFKELWKNRHINDEENAGKRVCLKYQLPLEEIALEDLKEGVRLDQEIEIQQCLDLSADSFNSALSKRYKVTKNNHSFWSEEGYYSFHDLKAYQYRNIPYLCKWY